MTHCKIASCVKTLRLTKDDKNKPNVIAFLKKQNKTTVWLYSDIKNMSIDHHETIFFKGHVFYIKLQNIYFTNNNMKQYYSHISFLIVGL